MEKSEKIWMDGKMVPWHEANVHVLTHTLHYGLGVFEGIRCYNSKKNGAAVFRLQEHIDRLFQSAIILGIEVPFSNNSFSARKPQENPSWPFRAKTWACSASRCLKTVAASGVKILLAERSYSFFCGTARSQVNKHLVQSHAVTLIPRSRLQFLESWRGRFLR